MIAVLVIFASVGACTDSTGGEAGPTEGATQTQPTGGDQSDPPSSGGAEPTVEIPPRPRDLSLDGVAPCSLLTAAQLSQLAAAHGFDVAPEAGVRENSTGAPFCSVRQSGEPFNAVDVLLVTTEGIEPWLSGKRNVDSWLVSIEGYPAANYKLAGTEDEECVTTVGVADGQQLMVDLQTLVDTDYRELCKVTEQVATMATQTLQTLR